MGHKLPFYRNCRCFMDNQYTEGGRGGYIRDPRYATDPHHYIRAFMLIQKDLLTLFDYVEPSVNNLRTHSHRIAELLFRTCVEVEANFKAILSDNGYSSTKETNMDDYKKLEPSHRLSSFEIKLPCWKGKTDCFKPFSSFNTNTSPNWYKAYNLVKHDRSKNFKDASFRYLVEAVCGLVALLSSQFHGEDFSCIDYLVCESGIGDGFDPAIGNYFWVKYPTDWPDNDKYDFIWPHMDKKRRKYKKLFPWNDDSH